MKVLIFALLVFGSAEAKNLTTQENCLECIANGFVFLKFDSSAKDEFLCAVLPKNYTITDMALSPWECAEIGVRRPRELFQTCHQGYGEAGMTNAFIP